MKIFKTFLKMSNKENCNTAATWWKKYSITLVSQNNSPLGLMQLQILAGVAEEWFVWDMSIKESNYINVASW